MAHRPHALLTFDEAKKRRAAINPEKGLEYIIFFDLDKGDHYRGLVEIQFFCTALEGIFFEWVGDNIDLLLINDVVVDATTLVQPNQPGKFFIPGERLKLDAHNILNIKFSNRYYRDGEGLHTYMDTDGRQYIYTSTEPFNQNRVIPCFDQPDLKGTFKRYISVPSDWVAVTSELAEFEGTFGDAKSSKKGDFYGQIFTHFQDVAQDKKFYEFLVSIPLSTYLNSLFVGAFHRFDLAPENRINNIPMAIYARETLKQFIEHQLDDIFESHKKSIEFFSDFFQYKYPFSKCDAIFCPEYAAGAMEYPGGISYSESRYLFRTKTPSIGEKSDRARVIFHEMAHMWFGDTVTMAWWDGLWLNESFADFCCFEAWTGTQDTLNFQVYDGRMAFLVRKTWGYREDAMISTHPIQHTVKDTLAAESIFDGITYSKGAACMKQLMAVLGEARFKAAMVQYFQKFALKNTELADLIGCCQDQVKDETHPIYNLNTWVEQHLTSAGLNTVLAVWDPATRGAAAELKIIQGSALPQHATLRFHKLNVAFIGKDGQTLETKEVILNASSETIITYNGDLEPAAILLNQGDRAFVRVQFDATSLSFFLQNLHKLPTLIDRGMILKYINDAVKFGTLRVSEYIPFILGFIKSEKSPQLLQFSLTELLEINNLIPPTPEIRKVFGLLVEKLSDPTATFEGNMVAMIFGSLLSFGKAPEDIEVLKQIVEGKTEIHHLKGFKPSLSQHWQVIFMCQSSSAYTSEQKQILIDELAAKDNTDSKKEWQLKIKGLVATPEERKQLLQQVFNPQDISYKEVEQICYGLSSGLLPTEIKEDYFEYYFEHFLQACRTLNPNFSRTLRVFLMPSSSGKNDFILEKLHAIVAQLNEKEDALKKALLMVVDRATNRKKLFEFNK